MHLPKYFFLYLIASTFQLSAQFHSIRFYGSGFNDRDRVKIPLVNGTTSLNINVGQDFTIEFWMKTSSGTNLSGAAANTGSNDDWTIGHIIVDRDVFGQGNFGDYGISLANGRIAFGVNNGNASYTLVGTGDLRDGLWHHVAVTRSNANGMLRIFIDGMMNASGTGPTGNVAYNPNRNLSTDCQSQGGLCINEPNIILGAEKHDYDPNTYPSFNGWMDELRISNSIRYVGNFTAPTTEFAVDGQTVGLFHFNEGSGNTIDDASGVSDGQLVPHAQASNEPWSNESPFSVLFIKNFKWDYLISGEELLFYCLEAWDDELDIYVEYFDEIKGNWVRLTPPIGQIFYDEGMTMLKYKKEEIKEGNYRLSVEKSDRTVVNGEIKRIVFEKPDSITLCYPNPVQDDLYVLTSENIDNVIFYDSKGKMVPSPSVNLQTKLLKFDLEGWASGYYYLQLSGEKFISSGCKVLKY